LVGFGEIGDGHEMLKIIWCGIAMMWFTARLRRRRRELGLGDLEIESFGFWGRGDWGGGKCRREVLIVVVKLWMVGVNMALICAFDWRTGLPLPVGVNTDFLFIRASFR
jgi:hypothetical protein